MNKENLIYFLIEELKSHPDLVIKHWYSYNGRCGEYEIINDRDLKNVVTEIIDKYEKNIT